MSGEYGYFINRYWIAEYIQYLQEVGVVLGCTTRAERTDCPKGTITCSPRGFSSRRSLPWDEGELEPPEWLSFNDLFSMSGYDVLSWVMRWVDPVC